LTTPTKNPHFFLFILLKIWGFGKKGIADFSLRKGSANSSALFQILTWISDRNADISVGITGCDDLQPKFFPRFASRTENPLWVGKPDHSLKKGGDPSAPSRTDTLFMLFPVFQRAWTISSPRLNRGLAYSLYGVTSSENSEDSENQTNQNLSEIGRFPVFMKSVNSFW